MKSLKKAIRLSGLVLLILLATLGIGIGGAVPIPPNKKREDANEIKIELVEVKEKLIKLTESEDMKN